jgi:hypothetical protein
MRSTSRCSSTGKRDVDIHLGADRALSHDFWAGRWVAAMRVTAGGAAEPGDGVGLPHGVGCVLGELGVFVDDDHQGGRGG